MQIIQSIYFSENIRAYRSIYYSIYMGHHLALYNLYCFILSYYCYSSTPNEVVQGILKKKLYSKNRYKAVWIIKKSQGWLYTVKNSIKAKFKASEWRFKRLLYAFRYKYKDRGLYRLKNDSREFQGIFFSRSTNVYY